MHSSCGSDIGQFGRRQDITIPEDLWQRLVRGRESFIVYEVYDAA